MKCTTSSLYLFILLVFISCKKEDIRSNTDDGSTDGTTAIKTFALTLNGSSFETTNVTISHNSGYIGELATVGDSLEFGISIADSIIPGTYSITTNSAFKISHSDDHNATIYNATSGNVHIITHDKTLKKISGTFNCTLTRISPSATKSVTKGQFSIYY